MGMERYEAYVRRARNTLAYDCGWSKDNLTGAWRTRRPIRNPERCNDCGLCWLYCPESCIDPENFAIDPAYCKGCGICAVECRAGAIEMKREEA